MEAAGTARGLRWSKCGVAAVPAPSVCPSICPSSPALSRPPAQAAGGARTPAAEPTEPLVQTRRGLDKHVRCEPGLAKEPSGASAWPRRVCRRTDRRGAAVRAGPGFELQPQGRRGAGVGTEEGADTADSGGGGRLGKPQALVEARCAVAAPVLCLGGGLRAFQSTVPLLSSPSPAFPVFRGDSVLFSPKGRLDRFPVCNPLPTCARTSRGRGGRLLVRLKNG